MFSQNVKDSKNSARLRKGETAAKSSTVQERGQRGLKSWHEIRKFIVPTSADKADLPQRHGSSLGPFHQMITLLLRFIRDNEYILSGYRPTTGSFRRSFESLGYIHNETVNIYSHVVGAIMFATIPIPIYTTLGLGYPTTSMADLVVLSTFFYGVAICFLLSATFHVIANHSPGIQKIGNQLDYLGIVVLMWGSTIPSIYYGFYCDPKLQQVYWFNVSVLATLCIIATFHPRFRHPKLRPYRAFMYACLGLSAIVFMIHGLLLYGWNVQNQRMSLDWMMLMAFFNLVGAVAYASRIPEKWYPRKYDICGCSHQILHVLVILAGLAHMFGLFRAVDFVHTHRHLCT